MPIPWEKVILHGPQVLDAAKNLYGKWQTRSKHAEVDDAKDGRPREDNGLQSQVDKLHLRLQALEEAGEKQAALATDLAEQNQAVSVGIRTLKTHTEDLQKKVEDAVISQSGVDSRLHELSMRLQQADSDTAAMKKKMATLVVVSIFALLVSVAALFIAFPR